MCHDVYKFYKEKEEEEEKINRIIRKKCLLSNTKQTNKDEKQIKYFFENMTMEMTPRLRNIQTKKYKKDNN